MTPTAVAAVLATLVVTALVLVTVRLHRVAARKAARLRARLFEIGNETERERDAALAAITRVHIAANRVMDYDRERAAR